MSGPGRQHLKGHVFREYMVSLVLQGLLDLNDVASQIGRRCPKSGGGHLGVGMCAAFHRLTIASVGCSCETLKRLGQGLLIGAVTHPDRREHRIVQ